MRETEIAVVGLGAMGSAALYHLARQGAAPIGIEQYAVGHAAGSSHGHSRAFRRFYHDPLYVEMVEAALFLWQELEQLSNEQLLTLSGMLSWAQQENADFRQNLHTMEITQTPHEQLTPAEVATRFPALRLPTDATACYIPSAGFLDAGRAVQTHVDQARRFGATVYEQVQLQQLDLSRERPELETSAGRFRCEHLIITPGPWAADLLADLKLPLRVTRQQKFYFQPQDPSAYQPDRLPVYADYDRNFYGFPNYGMGIKVADDTLGDVTTPEAIDRTLDAQKRADLQSWLESLMPGLAPTFVTGATCMYTLTPDRDFLIGPHPQHANLLIGGGFSGHGFKFSTFVGKMLADLALTGTTRYPIDRFRLDRFES